jgi:regulatory protein
LPEDQYEEVLHDLLAAKARTLKDKDSYSRRGKLLAFAQSRGFEVEEALRVISKI